MPDTLVTRRAAWACAILLPGIAGARPPDVPMIPGMVIVLAVSNRVAAQATPGVDHVAQGDYEAIFQLTDVSPAGVALSAFIDGVDEAGEHRQAAVPRRVNTQDLQSARLQVLGFHSDDPEVLGGTTALGPSLLIVHELATTGTAAYSMKNFWKQGTVSGTLTSGNPRTVPFPVLLNGRRVELTALHAAGMVGGGGTARPFEQLILDDPRHPLSLHISWGPRGGGFPFVPDFTRDVVRIDYPPEAPDFPIKDPTVSRSCRVELPGIYFDFNQATLKPPSRTALGALAAALRRSPHVRVRIEGHTDNIGGDHYNDDLSARRASAVKTALVRDYGLDGGFISTTGFGARRPIETNETLAGRARNRRVELVRDCPTAR